MQITSNRSKYSQEIKILPILQGTTTNKRLKILQFDSGPEHEIQQEGTSSCSSIDSIFLIKSDLMQLLRRRRSRSSVFIESWILNWYHQKSSEKIIEKKKPQNPSSSRDYTENLTFCQIPRESRLGSAQLEIESKIRSRVSKHINQNDSIKPKKDTLWHRFLISRQHKP